MLRINYYRAMAGVPASITWRSDYSLKAQAAALMMSANNALSHFPPVTWIGYTAAGAEAAQNSDISIGVYGPDAISGYMRDVGDSNYAVGHRRWLFYPQTQFMGTGDVNPPPPYYSANATWVHDDNYFGTRPAVRDTFVAWPPKGYVPYSVVFPRWSFSYPNATFESASVTMARGGTNVPVRLESVASGFGENTLVWVPDNLDANSGAVLSYEKPSNDIPITVTVSNVTISTQKKTFTYTVTVFDPQVPGADSALPIVTGSDTPTVGTSNAYSVAATPLASGFQFRSGQLALRTYVEGAENGLTRVTSKTSTGYNVLVNSPVYAGGSAFHMAMPVVEDQWIQLNDPVIPRAGARLRFRSRLGYMAPSQSAVAQISTDDGGSWTTEFTHIGDFTSRQTAFELIDLDMTKYAGRAIRARFVYAFASGSYYPQVGTDYGWLIDNIEWVNADDLVNPVVVDLPVGTPLDFRPAQAGSFFIQARSKIFGGYYGEWGLVKSVQATTSAVVPINLQNPIWVGNGLLEIGITGPVGKAVTLQTSTNLTQWTDASHFSITNGFAKIRQTISNSTAKTFYRLASP